MHVKKIAMAHAVALASVAGLSLAGTTAAHAFEPALVKQVAPKYPRAAERRSIEGTVTVNIDVDEAGKVAAVEVVEATPPGVFDRAALAAIERWEFEAGKPASNIQKQLSFKLAE